MKCLPYERFKGCADTARTEILRYIQNAENFYSQEFKPELIEKYFESQKVITDENGLEKGFAFPSNEKYYWWSGGVASYDEFYLPLTLDNFITDCQRAGIELSFNKTALQELPL